MDICCYLFVNEAVTKSFHVHFVIHLEVCLYDKYLAIELLDWVKCILTLVEIAKLPSLKIVS